MQRPFFDEVSSFNSLPAELKQIYYLLLSSTKEFNAFFSYIKFYSPALNTSEQIKTFFKDKVCSSALIEVIAKDHPVELAYSLALIHTQKRESITPPWVIMNYPQVEQIINQLRNKPCLTGCGYCNEALDGKIGLKSFFWV